MASQEEEVLAKIKALEKALDARLTEHAQAINKNKKILTGFLQSTAHTICIKNSEPQENYNYSDLENLIIERKKRLMH